VWTSSLLAQALAAQVVAVWASSPYDGAPGAIESVEDRVTRVLGFDMVMNFSTLDFFDGKCISSTEDVLVI